MKRPPDDYALTKTHSRIPHKQEQNYLLLANLARIFRSHKAEVGEVIFAFVDEGKAMKTWTTLMAIPDASGVLIQPMVYARIIIDT